MSNEQQNTLNRRPSIHSSSARSRLSRQFSTLEIEVEYISTNQQSQPLTLTEPSAAVRNNLHPRDSSHPELNKVIEEEEEEEGEEDENNTTTPADNDTDTGAGVGVGSYAPNVRLPFRQYPATMSRPRAVRPSSQLYFQQQQQQPWLPHQFSDQSARHESASRRSIPSNHSSRYGTSGSGHVVGGHSVHTSISHSEYIQSSQILHDETPALSSSGSQTDEDDDEVHSPVECLDVLDDDGEGDVEREGARTPAGRQSEGEGAHKPIPLRIDHRPLEVETETPEVLKRERTRILERTVVSYRQIDFADISKIQRLKRGGYGEIHTAEWSRLSVVLKRSLPDNVKGAEEFEHELEILKRVHDYDFIVPFYGVTIDPVDNVRCIVMKHCTLGNLVTFLENNHDSLTWSERYRISIEITKGLEFLHKSGFHHRDLHSGNILLDDKKTAMICDFGLSRESNKGQTSDLGATVGVAPFLAPERFPLKRPVYTASCDIYSLGVIFWHISSGKIPFVKRLRDPQLLHELRDGHREQLVEGTPWEYQELIVKCWDKEPALRLQIDVVIGVLQTLIAKPAEPLPHHPRGFVVPSDSNSAALPVPPELDARMASLERASSALNRMVFDIQDPMMKDTVNFIEHSREAFRNQGQPVQPYSPSNPPKTPIYLCPLVGDLAGFQYYLSRSGPDHNPINESSPQTGDTALHLACLFLESPLATIKVLVELGADINLENLQGYTPVTILVSSNTQHCYEALKFFVMRGARIPAYIRNPITPLNSAQLYALHVVNESRQIPYHDNSNPVMAQAQQQQQLLFQQQQQQQGKRRFSRQRLSYQNQNVYQERGGRRVDRMIAQGRPLIHVVAAMQEDYWILDCLCEAGLDPAMSFGGETALVAAAAHLRIKNVEWLLNHDLDISSEAGVQRAIRVVKLLHQQGSAGRGGGGHGRSASASAAAVLGGDGGRGSNDYHLPYSSASKEYLENISDLGKYSWAGVAYGEADRISKDMVKPVLSLLEQWTGSRRIANRKEVATKLKVMYGATMDPFAVTQGGEPMASSVSLASTNSANSAGSQGHPYPYQFQHQYHQQQQVQQQQQQQQQQQTSMQRTVSPGNTLRGSKSLRKNQRHLIDQALSERPGRFW
ncbi:hypothetical protein BG015_006537 [Linnemannia schmuckeri]|uniref:Protein kinase domain-containing protein n=1 Tax=Linnemannia schmuckeri TaxID=64567 RepID=A0A9P5VC04_9FUNG|nr:hypothetical protein BG015_006537 [Linnemannia schmuckeri]